MRRPTFRQCTRRSYSSLSTRPPDNELYDRGCDLVEAAASIRRLAADPRGARALPAVLGCLEAALHELRGACLAMEQQPLGA